MKKLKTAIAFSKNVLTTGALFQTSSKVEQEITSKISDQPNQLIVEFGMGHGNITEVILSKMHESSTLYSFEINPEFCETVKEKIKDDRLHIINKGAEEAKNIIDKPVNLIVSSIPFTIFTNEKTQELLKMSYDLLASDCYFSQVQYSKVSRKKFEASFDEFEMIHLTKIPPEFIFHCQKK